MNLAGRGFAVTEEVDVSGDGQPLRIVKGGAFGEGDAVGVAIGHGVEGLRPLLAEGAQAAKVGELGVQGRPFGERARQAVGERVHPPVEMIGGRRGFDRVFEPRSLVGGVGAVDGQRLGKRRQGRRQHQHRH